LRFLGFLEICTRKVLEVVQFPSTCFHEFRVSWFRGKFVVHEMPNPILVLGLRLRGGGGVGVWYGLRCVFQLLLNPYITLLLLLLQAL
jgi:hypothetical protein